ncbi:MAG: rRNA maturation RNase YbeY [Candidatus Pacebacteria bacterium]|jgi:probable rRNA maturation factor|nr:rRNA maturation RNase YbeY [Candidatus Paceibacterota bacterium]MBP9058667.1 rRNA maturation RNase YbeY [Candidatus Paceibacterota bacterium]MBP9770092.1 rRNA maturation RNase YbeY [Candidatus Paceibacterota bacterium]
MVRLETISINNKTKSKLPSLPFLDMKNYVLGKKYEISVLVSGEKTSRELNKKYRNKNYTPDILSFPLDENSGEIILTPKAVSRKAKLFGLSEKNMYGFLFIHGLLHLKGHEHSAKMDEEEYRIAKKFGIKIS